MKIVFRCPLALRSHLSPPVLARHYMPAWFEQMSTHIPASLPQSTVATARTNKAVVRSMQCGFLLRLPANITVERGGFVRWDWPVGPGSFSQFGRSVVQLSDPLFWQGKPNADQGRFMMTFINHWRISFIEGWDLLLTHPFYHDHLPFRVVPMIHSHQECHERFIHVPTTWIDPDFTGLIPRGTPYAMGIMLPVENVDLVLEDIPTNSEQPVTNAHHAMEDSLVPHTLLYPRRRRTMQIDRPEVRASLVR